MGLLYSISIFIVLVIVAIMMLGYLPASIHGVSLVPPDTGTVASGTTSSTTTYITQPGFTGPTGAPHIIGPKGNPPNY